MKKLKYQLMVEANFGTEDRPQIERIFAGKERLSTEGNYEADLSIARSEAYNGEVIVEDVPDEPQEPTQLDNVEAQATYTAMMTDTLLEG